MSCGGRVGVVPTSLRYGPIRVAHVPDDSTSPDAPADVSEPVDAGEQAPDEETLLGDAEQAIDDARRRLAEVPAQLVVTNHVMGLYELAAIHLSATPPNLDATSLAIDAVGSLVDGLGDRLGPETPTLRNALANIRLAFVSVRSASRSGGGEGADRSGDDTAAADDDTLGTQ